MNNNIQSAITKQHMQDKVSCMFSFAFSSIPSFPNIQYFQAHQQGAKQENSYVIV